MKPLQLNCRRTISFVSLENNVYICSVINHINLIRHENKEDGHDE